MPMDWLCRCIGQLEAFRWRNDTAVKKADQEPLVRRLDDLIRSMQKLLTVRRHPQPGA